MVNHICESFSCKSQHTVPYMIIPGSEQMASMYMKILRVSRSQYWHTDAMPLSMILQKNHRPECETVLLWCSCECPRFPDSIRSSIHCFSLFGHWFPYQNHFPEIRLQKGLRRTDLHFCLKDADHMFCRMSE